MSDACTIELTVPGTLLFRDLAVRVVMEACKLLSQAAGVAASVSNGEESANSSLALSERFDFSNEFTIAFTSAFSEIFNNIPIHAYEGQGNGTIRFAIQIGPDRLTVEIVDNGKSFDINKVPPPDDLPMGGMGIHIARMMLDELVYEPGPPNRWRLVKYIQAAQDVPPSPEESPEESHRSEHAEHDDPEHVSSS